MVTRGLYVRLEALPGKEEELAEFLKGAISLVNAEPDTVNWYTWRMGPHSFGIFDTFVDEAGENAHLTGEVAKALFAKAPELLNAEPHIEKVEFLAAK